MIGLNACTSYNPPRVYIPELQKQGEVNLEVAPSQAFLGYTPSDHLTLHLGTRYVYTSNNNQFLGFQSYERVLGAELGAHFVHSLLKSLSFSAGGGVGYTQRSVSFDQYQINEYSGRVVKFAGINTSSIIRPSAQLSLSYHLRETLSVSVFSRAHQAFFTDNALIKEDPMMLEGGLHIKAEGKDSAVGMYCQGLGRYFLRGSAFPDVDVVNPNQWRSAVNTGDPMIPGDMLKSAGNVMPFDVSCGLTFKLN